MAVPLIIAGVGLAFSAYQAVQEAKKEREAKRAIENLERQELSNMAEGLQVSTLGSDLAREEAGRFAMSKVDALQADQRLLLGGLGRSEAGLTDLNRKLQADLDLQQKQIDKEVMTDDQRIRQLQEQREIADVAALSSQITASNQNKMAAIGTGIQAAGMIGNTLGTSPSDVTGTGALDASTTTGKTTADIDSNSKSFLGTKTGGSGMGATSSEYLNINLQPLLKPKKGTPVNGTPRIGGLEIYPGYKTDEYGNLIFD